MSDCEKMIVRAGYNEIAERYLAWSERVVNDPSGRFLNEFAGRLPDGVSPPSSATPGHP